MEMISILLSRLMMYELAAAGAVDKRLSVATSRAERRKETCARARAADRPQMTPDGVERGRLNQRR